MKEFPQSVYCDEQLPKTTKVFRSDFYCKTVENEEELKEAEKQGFRTTLEKAKVKRGPKPKAEKTDVNS